MKKLKFRFQDEKNNLQTQITFSREVLRNATTRFIKAKKEFNQICEKQEKKIELLTWKITQLRKLEIDGNYE